MEWIFQNHQKRKVEEMTNEEKRELRQMVKDGWSFEDIKGCVSCCEATIKNYIKSFRRLTNEPTKTPNLKTKT